MVEGMNTGVASYGYLMVDQTEKESTQEEREREMK